MIGRRASKPTLILTLLLIAAVCSIGGCKMFGDLMKEEYAAFDSPDGKYKIVVMRNKTLTGSAPGQAGDSPGEVRLINKNGDVLEKTDVEMVQLVEKVEWTDKNVYIKLIADWNLPE